MNTLREALQEYLDLRRGLGYKMHDAGLLLPKFVGFMEQRCTSTSAPAWPSSGLNVLRYSPPSGPGAFASCAASLGVPARAVPCVFPSMPRASFFSFSSLRA